MPKLALKIVTFFRKFYWWVTRPDRLGVKIIVDYNEQILLVKNKYDRFWCLPGGGVKNDENLSVAAKRELGEECGVEETNFRLLRFFYSSREYKHDHIALFTTRLDKLPQLKNGIEIEACQFFDVTNLPQEVSPATKRRILEYQKGTINGGRW